MIRWNRMCAVAAVALAAVGTATAESDVDLYSGWKAVRIATPKPAQIETARALGLELLSCHETHTLTEYLVAPHQLAALKASGLQFTVSSEDMGATIGEFRQEVANRAQQDGLGFYDNYHNFDTLVARMNNLADANPGLAQMIDIGDSLQGRDLWMLRITGPDAGPKPGVLFNGCQHAREWISPATVMYIAEELITGYGSDPRITALVDNVELYLIVVVNPDGYQFSWDTNRLWRKNRRLNTDGSIGVDLNRNWDFGWGGGGSSPDPSSDTYHGEFGFSEPETAALRDFYQSHPNIVANIDFHSYGQLVLYPWAMQPGPPDDGGLHGSIAQSMVSAIYDVHQESYTPGPVMDTLYQASGGSIDWTWGAENVVSYTIELRDNGQNGFVLPPEQIIPTVEEAIEAALVLAERAAAGAVFAASLPDVIEADGSTAIPLEIVTFPGIELDPSTARLHYRSGAAGPFDTVSIAHAGGTAYEVIFPAAPCDETLEYYLEVENTLGIVYTSPPTAPLSLHSAEVALLTTLLADDFENDLGWTVVSSSITGGEWERGVPAGGGLRGDPANDFDGSGSCYLTQNVEGNSDVDGGPTHLISPVFDLSATTSPQLQFALWHHSENGVIDLFEIAVSDNGGDDWVVIEETSVTAGWMGRSIALAPHIALTDNVRVRFSANDTPNDSVTESAIDAVRIIEVEPCTAVVGDVDGDGLVGFSDLLVVLGAWGPCGTPCPADVDNDGTVGFGDLLVVLGAWS